MSDEDIISTLVKGRERFRQLIQVYKKERNAMASGASGVDALSEADKLLASALSYLKLLPEKPSTACSSAETGAYVGRLLREIGEMLESTMIMDRELRGSFRQKPGRATPSVSRSRALNSYAMT